MATLQMLPVVGNLQISDSTANNDVDIAKKLNERLWAEAFSQLRSRLQKKDVKQFQADSFETLQKYVMSQRKIYRDKPVTKLLMRLEPFFERLRSFSGVFETFAQAHDIAGLLWGSIKLVLQLASKFNEIFEKMVVMLEKIDKHLPRFETYIKAFPHSTRISDAALNLYIKIAGFQLDSILFLQRNPLRNLLRGAWASFEATFQKCLAEIQECCDSLDVEAVAANIMSDISRHEELKELLSRREQPVVDKRPKLPCHILHLPRNARFSGRQSILDDLQSALVLPSDKVEQRSVAIAGLGGVGKTQLAAEFIWRNQDKFDIILWTHADTSAKLEKGFLKLAKHLDISDVNPSADTSKVVEAVVHWLSTENYSWLLIFDNVDEGIILQPFWPVCSRGSILVTTRNTSPKATPASISLHLRPLAHDEGRDLLVVSIKEMGQNSIEIDADAAFRLSMVLGGLPLALAQIAGYISTIGCSVEEFLEMFEETQHSSGEIISDLDSTDFNYDYTLATVWDLTLAKLDPKAFFLLQMMAYLDPDCIPEAVFTSPESSKVDLGTDFPKSKVKYFEALKSLCTYDFVRRDAKMKTLSIHRLLQKSVRERLSDSGRPAIFRFVVQLLSAVYPQQKLGMAMDRFWEKCDLFLPQVISVIGHYDWAVETDRPSELDVELTEQSAMELVELLHNATWFMQEKGMFKQLLPIAMIGENILKSIGRAESMLMGELYNTVGNVYLEIGNHQECQEYFTKVKVIREALNPADSPVVANITNNLSLAETALGNYQVAETLSRRVIAIRENLPDDKYAEYKKNTLPINNSNLCRILWVMDKLDEAAEIGERAMALAKNSFGLRSRNTAQATFNLADVRMKQGHPDALKLHLQALVLRKDVLGNHYQTAGSCYKVACLFLERRDLKAARELLEEAVTIYEASFACEGSLARTLVKLSKTVLEMGEEAKAREILTKAIGLLKILLTDLPQEKDMLEKLDSLVPYVDR
ncbi:NB-ARC domain-containing protein [Trichoderma simmonsii]|uniref:NB-ARC domain-containing protein n=2 Tax=Trichoderma simmonsii TaxID=1491479 RepID=A0A8G0LL82_9HYPO|nr:NB-ARC domain-containing protein [Trichoderma simmonsii]